MKFTHVLLALILSCIISSNAFAFYDSETGRFLNRDPLGEYGGVNLYAITTNDTVNYLDPYGLSPLSIIAKRVAKVGIKKGINEYVENRIKKEILGSIKEKSYKKAAKEIGDEALEVLNMMDSAWWEFIIECVPIGGDIYSAGKFGKQLKEIDKRLEELEKKARFLKENDVLLSRWDKSTYDSAFESVIDHADRKGFDVDSD
jgi:hypothetical protein